jgi:hypothetical protein
LFIPVPVNGSNGLIMLSSGITLVGSLLWDAHHSMFSMGTLLSSLLSLWMLISLLQICHPSCLTVSS